MPKDEAARVLGCVRQSYKVIQNVEAFGFATALLGQGVEFETAGSIRNGKIVYMLARKPENIIVKDDTIGEYLLITNSHDGTRSMQVFFTGIRVVCSNTLHAAMRGAKNMVKIPHKGDIEEQIKLAKGILGLADKYFTRFGAMAVTLADVKMTKDNAREFLKTLWPDGESKRGITFATKSRDEVMWLFNGGQMGGSQDAVNGTAWGLLNAITESVDHPAKITRTRNRNPLEVAFERSMLTSGANFKSLAFDRLVDFTGVGDGELTNMEVATVN